MSEQDDVVFITIYREDREWINETKGDLNRERRLHNILENYKRAGLDAQYSGVKA